MKSADYQNVLARHLSTYREGRLGVAERGTYRHKGRMLRYGHILPSDLLWLNVMEPFRKEVSDYVRRRDVKLHKYFHHLNSSQAFALNLFWPFAARSPEALAAALGSSAVDALQLEHVEDPKEGTNVDVTWLADGGRAYCEVKLSEREFGGADQDARHMAKLEGRYGPVLRPLLPAEDLRPQRFFKAYQIYRNLWLAARPGHELDSVWFVLPKANEKLVSQLDSVLGRVGPSLNRRVHVMYVEPILERLSVDAALGWYARLLREKYAV